MNLTMCRALNITLSKPNFLSTNAQMHKLDKQKTVIKRKPFIIGYLMPMMNLIIIV